MASARMEPATRAGSIRFGDARLHRHHSPRYPDRDAEGSGTGGQPQGWQTRATQRVCHRVLRRPSQRRSEIHRRQISALHPWSLQYECSQHSVSSCRSDGPQFYCCIWPESRCVYALYGSLGETGALIHEVICDKSVVRSCAYELVHGQDAVGARLYSQQLLRTPRFA